MQKWPDNYDVEGVPPGVFSPQPLRDSQRAVRDVTAAELEIYYGDGARVVYTDELGNFLPASVFYESNGRRRQVYYLDRAPASSYNPDGTQIHYYAAAGNKLTNDTIDPLYPGPDPDPEPGPAPDAGALVSVDRLLAFMADEMISEDVAAAAVDTASALIAAYTRDRHVTRTGDPRPGVSAVALTAAARIAANPGQITKQDTAGSFSTRRGAGFSGFTLGEQAVLNRYRKRATG